MGEEKLVFVSCGQVSETEINLGRNIVALIGRRPGLTAYFAQNVSSVDALSASIFKSLAGASAFVTVMHRRGTVQGRPGDEERTRASVWIEQEIAIAAFLKSTTRSDLEVLAYAQKGLYREGVRQVLLLNPIEFEEEGEILADLAPKIEKWNLKPLSSPGPRLEAELKYSVLSHAVDRHEYQLEVALRNVGDVSIPEVEYRLTFPRPFVRPNIMHSTERREMATPTHRVFQGKYPVNLYPGDAGSIKPFSYVVTDELHDRDDDMKLLVTVVLMVDNRQIGSARKELQELQEF